MQARLVDEAARQIPVLAEADVVVVGGGTGGVVAALAAAKNGARTVLVEQHGHLGGALINGAVTVHSFFNGYMQYPRAGRQQVVKGIPQEIVDAMVAAGGCAGHVEVEVGRNYDPITTNFDPEIYKHVAFEMMGKYGVKVLVHTLFVDVLKNAQGVYGIVVESKSGRQAILAKELVDCSGDGDVAARAGADFIPEAKQDRQYSVALSWGMGNVDTEVAVAFGREKGILNHLARRGDGKGAVERFGLELRKHETIGPLMEKVGMWGPVIVSTQNRQLNYINCTNFRPTDALNIEEISKAEMTLRQQIDRMVRLLRENVPGFQDAYLNWTGVQIGVRRTRTIICEHDMTLQEIMDATDFEDRVGRFSFMDFPREEKMRVKDGGSYTFPYRALIPKNVDHVLVAGRMTTSEWAAHMSTRNTVACMVQSEAAGTAAALAAREGIPSRKLDVKKLQDTLRRNGVVVDNPAK